MIVVAAVAAASAGDDHALTQQHTDTTLIICYDLKVGDTAADLHQLFIAT